jgi:hypothetical protein
MECHGRSMSYHGAAVYINNYNHHYNEAVNFNNFTNGFK